MSCATFCSTERRRTKLRGRNKRFFLFSSSSSPVWCIVTAKRKEREEKGWRTFDPILEPFSNLLFHTRNLCSSLSIDYYAVFEPTFLWHTPSRNERQVERKWEGFCEWDPWKPKRKNWRQNCEHNSWRQLKEWSGPRIDPHSDTARTRIEDTRNTHVCIYSTHVHSLPSFREQNSNRTEQLRARKWESNFFKFSLFLLLLFNSLSSVLIQWGNLD